MSKATIYISYNKNKQEEEVEDDDDSNERKISLIEEMVV
jgi:hypothetical protein